MKKNDKRIRWTDNEVKQFKKMFPNTDNEKIAAHFNISISAVRSWATRLQLAKSQRYWSGDQIVFIKKNWEVLTPEEIGKEIGRTKWAVINKYREVTGLRG